MTCGACSFAVTGGLGEWWRLFDSVFWWLGKCFFWFLFRLMANPIENCGFSIQTGFQALKVELQNLVLSISEVSNVQGGDSFASKAASDRAKEVLSVRGEPKGLLCNYKLNLRVLETWLMLTLQIQLLEKVT